MALSTGISIFWMFVSATFGQISIATFFMKQESSTRIHSRLRLKTIQDTFIKISWPSVTPLRIAILVTRSCTSIRSINSVWPSIKDHSRERIILRQGLTGKSSSEKPRRLCIIDRLSSRKAHRMKKFTYYKLKHIKGSIKWGRENYRLKQL